MNQYGDLSKLVKPSSECAELICLMGQNTWYPHAYINKTTVITLEFHNYIIQIKDHFSSNLNNPLWKFTVVFTLVLELNVDT